MVVRVSCIINSWFGITLRGAKGPLQNGISLEQYCCSTERFESRKVTAERAGTEMGQYERHRAPILLSRFSLVLKNLNKQYI